MLCLLLDVHTLPCRLTLSSTGYHSASLTHVRGGGGGDGGSMQAEADQGAAKRRKFPTTESESSSMLEEEGGEPFDVAGAAIDEDAEICCVCLDALGDNTVTPLLSRGGCAMLQRPRHCTAAPRR